MPDLSFRPGRPDDSSDLAILFDAASRRVCAWYWGTMATPSQSWLEVGRGRIRDLPENNAFHAKWHIAELQGQTIGAFFGFSIPDPYDRLTATDLGGRLVTPGLIDCHSHVVFAGDRAQEFEMRLNGASYADIARAGGGILSTVTATRAASEADLLATALDRVDQMIATGATTIEVKSGYGLTVTDELKLLRVARRIVHEANLGEVRLSEEAWRVLGAPADFKALEAFQSKTLGEMRTYGRPLAVTGGKAGTAAGQKKGRAGTAVKSPRAAE